MEIISAVFLNWIPKQRWWEQLGMLIAKAMVKSDPLTAELFGIAARGGW